MSYEMSYQEKSQTVYLRYYGVLVADDVIDSLDRMFNDDVKADEIAIIIADHSDVTFPRINAWEIKDFVEKFKTLCHNFENMFIATVTPNDLNYGLARVLDAYLNNINCRHNVFRTVEEAAVWLADGGK